MKSLLINNAKKKLKKWIIGLLIAALPYLLIIIIVISGFSAVTSFFKNLFSWGEKNNIDINNCTLEQLIEAVKDKDIFTNDMLNEMMIDRKSLRRLLELVNEHNKKEEKKDIIVDMNYVYYTVEDVEIEVEVEDSNSDNDRNSDNENGADSAGAEAGANSGNESSDIESGSAGEASDINKKTEKRVVKTAVEHRGVEAVKLEVNNNHFLDAYDIDWQTVYIFCLYKSMSNYSNWTYGGITYDDEGNPVEIEEMSLTEKEIKEILDVLVPKLSYYFNAVQNSKTKYSLSEASAVSSKYYEFSVDKNGLIIKYYGYLPVSVLRRADGPSFTDIYTNNSGVITGMTTYSAKERFLQLANQYNSNFDLNMFYTLLENLPGGKAVADKYRYIFSLKEWEEP